MRDVTEGLNHVRDVGTHNPFVSPFIREIHGLTIDREISTAQVQKLDTRCG